MMVIVMVIVMMIVTMILMMIDDSDGDSVDDSVDDTDVDNEDVSSPDGPGAQEVGGGAGGGAGVGGGAAHTGPRLGVRAVTEQEGDNRFCAVQVYGTLTCTVLCSTGVLYTHLYCSVQYRCTLTSAGTSGAA